MGTVRDAFAAADSGSSGGVVTVADSRIASGLTAAGIGALPTTTLTVDDPVLLGRPPDSGFAVDPVCTASRPSGVSWVRTRPTFSGQNAALTFWHRPLHAITAAFTAAGFRIAVISEPAPAPGARERFPDELGKFPPGASFLCFLFFVLEPV